MKKTTTPRSVLEGALRTAASRMRGALRLRNPKVFLIGRNKTGTTSLKLALRALGYRVGSQRAAELLMEDWGRRDFRRLIALVHTADAFQDVPFSHDYTFQAMDQAFPGSRFILSVREDADQWYRSVTAYASTRLGLDHLPTRADLERDPYVYPGWSWRNRELVWGPEADDLWNRERLVGHYLRHNARVQDYFRHRPEDLLVLNVAWPDAMQRLCAFLGKPETGRSMPEVNVTARKGSAETTPAEQPLRA